MTITPEIIDAECRLTEALSATLYDLGPGLMRQFGLSEAELLQAVLIASCNVAALAAMGQVGGTVRGAVELADKIHAAASGNC